MKMYSQSELRAMPKDKLRTHLDALMAETERLHAERRAAQEAATPTPSPAPEPELTPTTPVAKLPRRARKVVAQFDAMSDSEQIASLREVWG